MNQPHYPPPPYHPQPPQSGPSAGKVVLIVLGTLGLLVFGSCAVCTLAVGAGAEKAQQDREKREAAEVEQLAKCAEAEVVSWSTIAAALEDNEAKVVAAWKNSCAKVTGVVDSIGSGLGDEPYVVIGTGERFSLQNLHCEPRDPQAALQLSKGQTITVWGRGGGEIMGSLMLEECQW